MTTQWLTTAANPRNTMHGHDQGQRGWKLHAIEAPDEATFAAVRFKSAACGLRPAHGWGLDLFITDKCKRCALARSKAQGVDLTKEASNG